MNVKSVKYLRFVLLFAFLFTLLSAFFIITSTSFAGGWHKLGVTEGNSGNVFDPDAGLWISTSGTGVYNDTKKAKIPHLGLSTSSNKCRACHAVHDADNTKNGVDQNGNYDPTQPKQLGNNTTGTGKQFKLLRNEDRKTECFFCHGPVGALTSYKKKPYADMKLNGTGGVVPAKGEHTLGAKAIPDSTVDATFLQADGLQCGVCHSVHGGWTLNDVPQAGALDTRILRRDPAQNGNGNYNQDGDYIGSGQGDGAAAGVINVSDQGNSNKPIETFKRSDEDTQGDKYKEQLLGQSGENVVLAGFCGDCHNKNVNWDRGGYSPSDPNDPNPAINDPDWPNNDPNLPPYNSSKLPSTQGERPNKGGHPLGDTDEYIDVYGRLKIVAAKMWNGYLTCDVCHSSRTSSTSKFPHQSVGHKLLLDTYTDTSSALSPRDPGTINHQDQNYTTWLKPWDTEFHPGKNDAYTGDPNRPLPNLQKKICMTCHGDYVGKPDDPSSF